ncbi:hypothetical protein [Nocardiopsis ganjiahuensis]|uniref:hypothetical protein n=1 Tax=Nocardiopsis ganjiahuensis TaxID=239984 RepID=UPI0012691900|nr:hypothetical protein [Nocardiopsis ganjiahuensis]
MTPAEWVESWKIQEDYKYLSPGDVERSARRLIDDCRSSGYISGGKPDVLGYLSDYTSNNPVDRVDHKSFAFWSFQSSPDSSTAPVESHFQAKACAKTRNYQVLSETPVGEKLDSYRLFDEPIIEHLEEFYDVSPSVVEQGRDAAWADLSESFVEAARGEVQVFVPDVHPESILGKNELPALVKHPDVGAENIKFVTDFPEHAHLPGSVDRFLAHDQVRAQVSMDYYDEKGPSADVLAREGLPPSTPPPHALAHKLDGIKLPPGLQDERDRASELLRSGDSYKDLKGPGTGVAATVGPSGPPTATRTVPAVADPTPATSTSPTTSHLLHRGSRGAPTAARSAGAGTRSASVGPDVTKAHEHAGPAVRGAASKARPAQPRSPRQDGPGKGHGRGD